MTPDWNGVQGKVHLFERSSDSAPWAIVGQPIPVVVGKAGLAWGIGLHAPQNDAMLKREGDMKSPAGIFSIGTAFGFAKQEEMPFLRIEYLCLGPTVEAVDDPHSKYYNQIVDAAKVACDWKSSEKMGQIPLYAPGFVINHNFPHPKPYAGSAIFFHVWRSSHSGTAGCTATSREHLSSILLWLEREKDPVIVQFPLPEYTNLRDGWRLPELP